MPHAIVGVWRVHTKGAPAPYHMFTFHSDGTMQQSNPPAGNTETSDTAGTGIWKARGKEVKVRFEEFRMDRKDRTITRGVVDCVVAVTEDVFSGDCQFNIYDPKTGDHLKGPFHATLTARRVTLT